MICKQKLTAKLYFKNLPTKYLRNTGLFKTYNSNGDTRTQS